MDKLYKKAQLVVLAICIAGITSVALSDAASQEEWSFYCGKDVTALKKYTQYEQCKAAMQESRGCGCRRTDGPYALLNKVADVAFGLLN